uniref:J domain-containing protein n=1 Tax=Anopheles stephensi TaxID=30069 RepID=A0A182YBV9_ANOST
MSIQTLEKCEKYFGTKDIYKLFGIEKSETIPDIRKAYYRLLLQNHPGAASESDKPVAIEKAKLLETLYNVLGDPDALPQYNEHGVIDAETEAAVNEKYNGLFRRPATMEDIDIYHECYKGSRKEWADIKKEYLKGKGCINWMMKHLQFMQYIDEPRLIAIVQAMIDSKEVPEYETFTKEPAEKRYCRHLQFILEAGIVYMLRKKEQRGLDRAKDEQTLAAERQVAFDEIMNSIEARYRDAQKQKGNCRQY